MPPDPPRGVRSNSRQLAPPTSEKLSTPLIEYVYMSTFSLSFCLEVCPLSECPLSVNLHAYHCNIFSSRARSKTTWRQTNSRVGVASHSADQWEESTLRVRGENQVSVGAQELKPVWQGGLVTVKETLQRCWTTGYTACARRPVKLVETNAANLTHHCVLRADQTPA